MKTALIFFREKNNFFDGEYYQKITDIFLNNGVSVDEVAILSPSDLSVFILRLEQLKNTFDNLVIFDGENLEFSVKEVVAKEFDTLLMENENAKSFITSVCKNLSEEQISSYARLPSEGTLIPNATGVYQGFILDGEQFTLAILPERLMECKIMCEKHLLPYLNEKQSRGSSQMLFKFFGNAKKCEQALKNAKGQNEGITYNIFSRFGDGKITINFDESVSAENKAEFTRQVVTELKDDIYAEFDTSLSERLFDILKLKNLKLSVAESFTGGGVANAMIKNSGVSQYFDEGLITYSNESKIDRLGVSVGAIRREGAVSATVAYQMVLGLLKKSGCDIALATTGIAGPNSDDTNKPVGLAFIAVGMNDGVHTYRYQFSGTREEIMETAKNTALFLTIKKLKNV